MNNLYMKVLILGLFLILAFSISQSVFAQEGIEDRFEELENEIKETKQSFEFTLWVQGILAGSTIALVIATIYNMYKTRKLVEKQLDAQERQTDAQEKDVDLKEKELKQKYRAHLTITDVDFKFHAKQHEQNMYKINFKFKIRNEGNEQARKIKAFGEVLETQRTIEDIASKEKRVEKIEIQTQVSLIKNDIYDCGIVWEMKNFKKGFVNIWITYAYSGKEFDEVVYIYEITGSQTHKRVGIYTHDRLLEIASKKITDY